MQVLAPEINAAKTSAYQDTKTTSELGNRSGGTAASNAATTDKLHGYFANLFGDLTGKAAGALMSAGGSLMGTGLSAYGQQISASQQQMRNWSQSILGHAMISGVQTAEEAGELYATKGQSTQASGDYSSGPG